MGASTPGVSETDVRDAAILAVLYTSGVRGEDPVTRTLADWDPQSDGIKVLGKGNKDIQFTAPVVRSRVTHTDSRAISGSYACHSVLSSPPSGVSRTRGGTSRAPREPFTESEAS